MIYSIGRAWNIHAQFMNKRTKKGENHRTAPRHRWIGEWKKQIGDGMGAMILSADIFIILLLFFFRNAECTQPQYHISCKRKITKRRLKCVGTRDPDNVWLHTKADVSSEWERGARRERHDMWTRTVGTTTERKKNCTRDPVTNVIYCIKNAFGYPSLIAIVIFFFVDFACVECNAISNTIPHIVLRLLFRIYPRLRHGQRKLIFFKRTNHFSNFRQRERIIKWWKHDNRQVGWPNRVRFEHHG